MTKGQSFRSRLALRFGATVLVLAVLGSTFGYLALRRILYDRLDATLLRLADIEAAATADSPDESVHFHDEVFLGSGQGHETILARYAQVWSVAGDPVARTRNLAGRDLPLPAAVRQHVISSTRPQLFDLEWEGNSYRAVLYPLGLVSPQHRIHLLQVAASTEHTDVVLFRVLAVLAGLVIVGGGTGTWLGWWLAGYAVRPVLEIIRQAETLEAHRPGHHITADTDADELRRLVSVLNAMLARIDSMLDSQRRFLADAGHAIKTPLTVLRGDIDVALRRPRSPHEYAEVLEQTLEDLKDASLLAEDLTTLASSDGGVLAPAREQIAVAPLLTKIAKKYERAVRDSGLRLEVRSEPELAVEGDPILLDRAVGNLIDNAVKYGQDGRRISLIAARLPPDSVAIRVSDDGPGMSPDERAKVFERFYRGDAGRQRVRGSGLGLAIVKAVAETFGGRVEIDTAPGRGTTVTLVCRRWACPSI